MLSQSQKEQINSIDLRDIVSHYKPGTKFVSQGNNWFCCCPFHDERDASFAIDKTPKGKWNQPRWKCQSGCSKGGVGAISLIAAFEGLNPSVPADYVAVLKIGANLAGIPFDEKDFGERVRFGADIEFVKPIAEHVLGIKEGYTDYGLELLGCDVKTLYDLKTDQLGNTVPVERTDKFGRAMKTYSFGKDFRPEHLLRDFNIVQLDYYISPEAICDKDDARNKKKAGEPRGYSVKTVATPEFPIFALIREHNGKQWGKIYRPLAESSRRFTYFGNEKPELSDYIFGDAMAMRVIGGEPAYKVCPDFGSYGAARIAVPEAGDVEKEEQAKTESEVPDPIDMEGESGEKSNGIRTLSKIIICSGITDAINTFYRGEVNVVFFNSEAPSIPFYIYNKIARACVDHYIMYDMDDTGRRNAMKIALQYPMLRYITLPDELRTLMGKNGKPCKDAKDYFTRYADLIRQRDKMGIGFHFRQLLKTSYQMKFWKKNVTMDKNDKVKSVSYDIESKNLFPFLNANGIWSYMNAETREMQYVYLHDNIVDVVKEKDLQTLFNKLMIAYIRNSRYYEEGIENIIHNSAKVKRDNLKSIPEVKLNFDSWDEDSDYLFFRNKAMRITAEGRKMEDYKSLKYQVYSDQIKPYDIQITEDTFRIVPNPAYLKMQEEHEKMKQRRDKVMEQFRNNTPRDVLQQEQIRNEMSLVRQRFKQSATRLKQMEECGRYCIEWLKPMEEQPVFVQFLYDTCRMYWRKEARGEQLTPEERMEQDAHFISKVNAIGYSLCRIRANTRPWILYAMENRVQQEGRSDGGSGKSLLFKMLGLVRPLDPIAGKTFDPKKGAANFCRIFPGRTNLVHIEDLDKKVEAETFYNLSDSDLSVKRLYEDEVVIPHKYVPVFMLTSNFPIDLSKGSSMRRFYVLAMSDYYHADSVDGSQKEFKPDMKFGEIMGKNASRQEVNEFFNFMASAMSFFLKHKQRINPPMEGVRYRSLVSDIGQEMANWCTAFFGKAENLNCYHSYETLLLLFSNFDTLSEKIREKLSPKVLREKLGKFCEYNGLLLNPPGCFKSEADRQSNRIRTTVWHTKVTKNDRGRILSYERVRSVAACWYVCRIGEEPLSPEEIPDAPLTDPWPEHASFDVEAPYKEAFLNSGAYLPPPPPLPEPLPQELRPIQTNGSTEAVPF